MFIKSLYTPDGQMHKHLFNRWWACYELTLSMLVHALFICKCECYTVWSISVIYKKKNVT